MLWFSLLLLFTCFSCSNFIFARSAILNENTLQRKKVDNGTSLLRERTSDNDRTCILPSATTGCGRVLFDAHNDLTLHLFTSSFQVIFTTAHLLSLLASFVSQLAGLYCCSFVPLGKQTAPLLLIQIMTKPEHFLVHFPLTVEHTHRHCGWQVCRTDCAQTAHSCLDSSSFVAGRRVHKLVLSVSDRPRQLLEQQIVEAANERNQFIFDRSCTAHLWHSTPSNSHMWLAWPQPPSQPMCLFLRFPWAFTTFFLHWLAVILFPFSLFDTLIVVASFSLEDSFPYR